jgi:type I restriction-modification system DNA methylase subunit
VYEHTLVTPETRKHFGTHSTPRPVAEYITAQIGTWQEDLPTLRVYEPFAGAGVFMVAALRSLRDRLPLDMTPKQRHEYLVNRIYGDEIEPFAIEVAMLSLILADYPNENGWAVFETDLFRDDVLRQRSRTAQIVLCNPPFEKFDEEEEWRYPEAVARDLSP